MTTPTQSLRHPGITLPITSAAQQVAQRFADLCPLAEKATQIRRNTLAVCAVNAYLQLMDVPTDVAAGDSWQPMMQMMADAADLHLPGVGVLSCRAIAPDDDTCYVPPEDWHDRAGYIAVALDESNKTATLLGFTTTVAEVEQVPLQQFGPIEGLIEQIHALRAADASTVSGTVSAPESVAAVAQSARSAITQFGDWAEGAFERSWQAVDELINPSNLSFAFRSAAGLAESDVQKSTELNISRAKLIDLGIALGQSIRVALVVHLTKVDEEQTDIVLQVRPLGDSPYLPEGLVLTVLDEEEATVMSATSREIDNYIQIRLSGRSGEPFGVRVAMGEAAGRTSSELTQEFNNCADQRRTTKKPVKHLIISFAAADGYVSDDVKARIAKSAVEELGYTYNQYVVVDHHRDDPGHDWNHDHDHIHIAVNMITLDGNRVDDWQDKRSFEEILRQLEVSEQLTTVVSSKKRKRKALSHGQTQRIKREIKEFKQGERTTLPLIPLNIKLQAAIDKASEDKPDLTTFIGRLQGLDIDVRPTISDKGRKRISYQLGEIKVRGSKLHNGSLTKLIAKRGINFDLQSDRSAMDAAVKGQRVSIPQSKQVTWSQIDLVSYLPEALHNELTGAQTNKKQNEERLTSDIEDKEANQEPTKLTDDKLLSIKSNVTKWLSSRPPEPRQEVIQGIKTEIKRLERLKTSGQRRINAQIQELKQLGSPRSLLNPFGVSSDVIEQKKTQI